MSLTMMIAAAVSPAAAQIEAAQIGAAVPSVPAGAVEQGVIAYPARFFADSSPTSALDMILRLPGFAFDKGVQVRGLAGSTGNVLIDGEPPVAKNDTLDEILKRIPAAAVERIDLVRGGAAGIDMQGRPVIANVVLRAAAGFRGATTLSASSVYDGRVFSNVRSEGQWRWPGGRSADFSLFYGYLPDDYWGDGARIRYRADRSLLQFSHYEADGKYFRTFATGAFETPFAGGKLKLNGAYQPFVNGFKVTDRFLLPADLVERQADRYEYFQAEVGARYTRPMTERGSLEAILFQQWRDVEQRSDFRGVVRRRFNLDKDTAETVGRLHAQYRLSRAWTVEAGGEAAYNTLDALTVLTADGVNIPLPAADVRVEEKRSELFATATWAPSPTLNVEMGVRQERSHVTSEGDLTLDKTLSFTKPRVLVTWSPTAIDQVRLRIEREVGQLNFDDFTASPTVANTGAVVAGNPDLSPQQAWVYSASYERRFGPDTTIGVTVRRSVLSDVVDRAPLFLNGVPVADGPGNIGDGWKDEAIVNFNAPMSLVGVPNAQLKGQITWRRSEVTDPLTGQKREISIVRPVEWDLHFVQDLRRWNTTWGIDVNKGAADLAGYRERYYRLSEIENRKFDTWVTIFAEYKPRPDLQLRLELLNVTERSFSRERNVYAGARDRTPLLFTEVRDLRWGRVIVVRLRKSY